MQRKSKEQLLDHYKQREPKRFIQYDGFSGWYMDEYADAEGDAKFSGETTELMQGSTVRLLIDPDAEKEVVLRLLRKLSDLSIMSYTAMVERLENQ